MSFRRRNQRSTINYIDNHDGSQIKLIPVSNSAGAGSLWLRNSSTGIMYPTTLTDKIGIGTSSPSYKLHVSSAATMATNIAAFLTPSANDNTDQYISIGRAISANKGLFIGHHYDSDGDTSSYGFIGIYGDTSAEGICIKRDGKIGIGTTSPSHKIDVVGDIQIQGDDGWNGDGDLGILRFGTSGNDTALAGRFTAGGAGPAFVIGIYKAGAGGYLGANSLDAITILGTSGNVGIGTTSPAEPLDVEGDGVTEGKFGSDNPIYLIAPSPTIGFNLYYDGGWKFGKGSSSEYASYIQLDPATGNLSFATSNYGNADATATLTPRLTIEQGGQVGIGTTTPSIALDVRTAGGSVIGVSGINSGDGAGLEVGIHGTGNRYATVDLVGDDTYTDYGVRLIRYNTGANTNSAIIHRGTGGLYMIVSQAGWLGFQTSGTTRMIINSVGDLLFGTAVSPGGTHGKVMLFADNTGDPTTPTNTAGIYAKDVSGTVEMFAIDEANNATQISPHDPLTGEWVYYSKNLKTGVVKKVNMERLIKAIEGLTGETFLEEWVDNGIE